MSAAIPVGTVVEIIRGLGEAVGLGERLVDLAKQRHPELRTDPPPPENEAYEAAIRRAKGEG